MQYNTVLTNSINHDLYKLDLFLVNLKNQNNIIERYINYVNFYIIIEF